tara:strand:+ start:813 stop:1319 length:507 start_codon:yes stop_codon:yes gene_type:complete
MAEIIDNFLSKYQFESLEKDILGTSFPWYFNRYATGKRYEDISQFTHTFYDNRSPWNGIGSNWYNIVEPFIIKLGAKTIYRIKANLNPRTFIHRNTGYHVDFKDNDPPHKTAVFYVDTNNGWTQFKKGGKVKSIANRIVIFDCDQVHAGFTATNQERRVVINFNFSDV